MLPNPSSDVSLNDLYHNFYSLIQVADSEKERSTEQLLKPLCSYSFKVQLIWDSTYRFHPENSLVASIQNYSNYYEKTFLDKFKPLKDAWYSYFSFFYKRVYPLGFIQKELIHEWQMLCTHISYEKKLETVIQKVLPPLQDYLIRVCQGSDVQDYSIRRNVIELQKFHNSTHFLLEKIQSNQSQWLSCLFQKYFCKNCFNHFHEIENYQAIFDLQSNLGSRLPYRMLIDIAFGDKFDEAKLAEFIQEVNQSGIEIRVLTKAFKGIYEHALKFHQIKRVRSRLPEPSFGRLTTLFHHYCLKGNFDLMDRDDSKLIAWRNTLKEGSTVRMRHYDEEKRLVITDFELGKQIGAKPPTEFDQFVYYEIKNGKEIKIEIADSDIDVLSYENLPTASLNDIESYLLCIGNNEIALGNRQESLLALENNEETPFIHCGMGTHLMSSIDFEGKVALCQKLQPLFSGPSWEQKKNDKSHQKKIGQILKNIIKMHATPIPLDPKYMMQGFNQEGCLVAKSTKLAKRGKKDWISLEKLIHAISGEDPQLLQNLLIESTFTTQPEYSKQHQEVRNAFLAGFKTPFQEQIYAIFTEGSKEIECIRKKSLSEIEKEKFQKTILDVYLESNWTFYLHPLIKRNAVDAFLKKGV